MVEWCTQNLRRDGSSFTWHQICNNQTALSVSTPFPWILKICAINGFIHYSFKKSHSHVKMCTVSVLGSRVNSATMILIINSVCVSFRCKGILVLSYALYRNSRMCVCVRCVCFRRKGILVWRMHYPRMCVCQVRVF